MMNEKRYDITEVCKTLGITSRALRFYEEKKLITSEKDIFSNRRKYTEAQMEEIRHVLVLRALGLSVKAIREIQMSHKDLKSAVLSRRAEIIASIRTKQRELSVLNDALVRMESGKELFETEISSTRSIDAISELCIKAIVLGNTDILYQYASPRLAKYMPKSIYESKREDTLSPLGAFCALEYTKRDSEFPHIVYGYAKYENLGLRMKLVFHGEKIDGLWLSYYEPNKEKTI